LHKELLKESPDDWHVNTNRVIAQIMGCGAEAICKVQHETHQVFERRRDRELAEANWASARSLEIDGEDGMGLELGIEGAGVNGSEEPDECAGREETLELEVSIDLTSDNDAAAQTYRETATTEVQADVKERSTAR
jgi:hypothetical protein